MFFAILYGGAVANADVQSQNIVGFSYIKIPQGWSMFTPVFKGVGAEAKFTLKDITVCNSNMQEFDDTRIAGNTEYNTQHQSRGGRVLLRTIQQVGGNLGATYAYTSLGWNSEHSNPDWGWGANSTAEILPGQGVIVNNTQGIDVYFQVSGEVELVPSIEAPTGWSVIGNNTPVDLKLKDITVCNSNGEEFDDTRIAGNTEYNTMHQSRGGRVLLRSMKQVGGNLDATYAYTSLGWNKEHSNPDWGWGANGDVDFKAGEAFLINNTQGIKVILKLPAPIK